MIKILFDATAISHHNGGVGEVVFNLLKNLTQNTELEIVAYTRKGIKDIKGINKNNCKIHELALPFSFFGWKRFVIEQIEIPLLIMKLKPDVIHYTSGFGVPIIPMSILSKKSKILLTIHDVIPITPFWELMTVFSQLLYKISLYLSLKKADKIVSISNFTKQDIMKYYSFVTDVSIIPNGINVRKNVSYDLNTQNDVFNKLKISKPYILYIGGYSKRKNVNKLIDSFILLQKEKNFESYKLVLAGKFENNVFLTNEVNKLKNSFCNKDIAPKIIVLGFIKDIEKEILYRNASIFVYPSLYEGFGLPVLEALIHEIPTITTLNSVMEEISTPYAKYINSSNPDDLKNAIKEIITQKNIWIENAKHAKQMISIKYNWKLITDKYFQIYLHLSNKS